MSKPATRGAVSPADLKNELEWRRCQSDEEYFLENFYHIPVVGVGPARFVLRDYQHEILSDIKEHDLLIALKARQIGMTTLAVAHAFYDAFFSDNKPWLLVSKNEKGAIKMLDRLTYAYDRLPAWLKRRGPKEVSRTQTAIVWDNGSRIEAVPSVASTGRGDSVFGAILDEFAFMDYPNEVFAAIEPLVYGKLIVISTANGMGNRFYDIWVDSQRSDSVWHSMFFPWDVVPSRDEDWYRRKKLSMRGQEWHFYQEYPSTPQEAFSKSGRVAFSQELLEYLDIREPEQYWSWSQEEGWAPGSPDDAFALRVWREPEVLVDEHDPSWIVQQPNYVIGVDVAEGLEHGDYTAITVWDANADELVASMYCHFPLDQLDYLLYDLGELYYWALQVVERNNQGIATLVGLQRLKYPRIYRSRKLATVRGKRRLDIGWITDRSSKPKMVSDFVKALRIQQVELHDETFVVESHSFVQDGKGGFSATEGKHDDFIMSALIGWQGVLEVEKYPTVWKPEGAQPLTFDDVLNIDDEPDLPFHPFDAPIGADVVSGSKRSVFLHNANIRTV